MHLPDVGYDLRMYLIKNNPGDPRKLEMCFDCKSCPEFSSRVVDPDGLVWTRQAQLSSISWIETSHSRIMSSRSVLWFMYACRVISCTVLVFMLDNLP